MRSLLEAFRAADKVVQLFRQRDVVADHLTKSVGSDLLESQPDLERAKAAGILWAGLEVVRYHLAIVVIELVVRRREAEGVAKRVRVARQNASRFQGAIEPFVRIHRDGVGVPQALQSGRWVGETGGWRAVGAVDVKP